jgi:hypothetical protein
MYRKTIAYTKDHLWFKESIGDIGTNLSQTNGKLLHKK